MLGEYFKKESNALYLLQIIIDVILVNLGFYTAFILKFGGVLPSRNIEPYISIIPLISLTAIVFFHIYSVSKYTERSFPEIICSIFLALSFIELSTVALTFFNRGFSFPRSIFFISFLLQFVYIVSWKYIVLKLYPIFNQPKSAIIIGKKEEADQIADKILLTREKSFEIKYICNNINSQLYTLIKQVDVVFLSHSIDKRDKEAIVSYCIEFNKIIYNVPELFEIVLANARLTQLDDMPILCIGSLQLSFEQRIAKRVFDVVISIIGIIFCLPIMLLASVAIKMYDGGPVIFAQERVTRGNYQFRLYKFRTMIVDAEKNTGPVLAKEKDSRIIPFGAFMRATRIDELPQLFNVLLGDMSIVGPRPERRYFIEKFKQDIPHFQYRVTVKAGITGLAQVLGKYTTSPKDKLTFDLFYIRNYSLLLDIKILFETIKTMLMKSSSQGLKGQVDSSIIKQRIS